MLSMSDRIRSARTAAGLSQTQLALETGVKRSAVAQWERRGGTHPSVSHLARIAVVTHVRFEWLATGRGCGKPEGEELETTQPAADYVRNDLEGNILSLVRRLPPRKRQVAHDIIEMLGA
ncbi:helix-turn-helix transcriptional regulator [Stenotrophomonas sp. PS02289]|uniref:helix-turn-helix domain-containing protein n=1 Tax=Stenotrophomonas sp. PS02289 TaxID=2991422 RepID=UPI00249CC006|nr:helix-turn-helix transcriptional regulator [Stenotrophomonas sp. PS02289]